MAFPSAFAAVVSEEKICDYLLNLDHPVGGNKVVWFRSLGYVATQWQKLADDLKRVAAADSEYETKQSPFGTKYEARGTIGQPGFRPGAVVTVWIATEDAPPRLITAYPA